MHPEMVSFYKESADFRVICVTDPVVRACLDAGKSPLETIIILADRCAAIQKQVTTLYENGLPPIILCKKESHEH
jgi:hypothetical protein